MNDTILFVLAVIISFFTGTRSIGSAIKYYKEEKYYLCGTEIMFLIVLTIALIRLFFTI